MKNILCYLLIVFSPALFAQLPETLLESIDRTEIYRDYEGSIYTHMRYKDANVIDENTGAYRAKLRYNALSGQIEYKKGSKLYTIVKTPKVHVRINKDYYYYSKFRDQRGLEREGYYILVDLNDKYKIYKKYTTKIKEPLMSNVIVKEKGSMSIVSTYYLEKDGNILELPQKNEELLSTLGDSSSELKDFIVAEKIRLKKEDDLVRLISKYSALKNMNNDTSKGLITNIENEN
ncbi:hypothetical protein [Aquimarina sp. 2201CG14-23]|uniref:hypothetical protein n=1 Tax=Aquimarina mycalae TaxID=3040073 RepID=UPI002478098D|nr:hypothetical protein [Aquimarina sp. 2201CG14-23]MDH7448152.1 hypothetical protein [Aquimarina sp. 2201CG14-23]